MLSTIRRYARLTIATVLAIAIMLPAMPRTAEARGALRSLVKVYSAGKIVRSGPATMKRAILVRRYMRELHGASGRKIGRQQFAMLRKCMQGPGCLTNKAPWTSKARKNAIQGWIANVGPGKWPKYRKDYKYGGATLAKGTNWDAHHVIPKALGGPHTWWNVVPSRRPSHLGFIHR